MRLDFETGLGLGYVRSVKVYLPREISFLQFRERMEDAGYTVRLRGTEVHQYPAAGDPLGVHRFELEPRRIKKLVKKRFLFWTWNTVEEGRDPEIHFPYFTVVGTFPTQLSTQLDMGCAYDLETDSMVTTCWYRDDPVALEPLVKRIREIFS